MAYYRPDDRVGGYPIETGLGEDGPSEYDAVNRGYQPGGEYVQQGYGAPRYEYERGRPVGGEYVGNAPEYYGPERPGGYGYGREGYEREGYGPSAYNQSYPPRQQQIRMESPIEYIEAEASDLGMGLRDSGKVSRHSRYEAEYGRPELDGYGRAPGYGGAAYEDDEVRRLRRELEHERRRTHELELETGAAVAYGLHERHEKEDVEDEEKGKKHHHFFGRD